LIEPQVAADELHDVTDAVLAAAGVLVGVAAHSIAAAEESVGVNQFRALVIIASRGPMHSAALAGAMGVHPSNATHRTCDRLVATGLLDRRDYPADRRHLQLTLTRKGRRLVDGVMKRRRAAVQKILVQMPTADERRLTEALNQFAEALQLSPGDLGLRRLDPAAPPAGRCSGRVDPYPHRGLLGGVPVLVRSAGRRQHLLRHVCPAVRPAAGEPVLRGGEPGGCGVDDRAHADRHHRYAVVCAPDGLGGPGRGELHPPWAAAVTPGVGRGGSCQPTSPRLVEAAVNSGEG